MPSFIPPLLHPFFSLVLLFVISHCTFSLSVWKLNTQHSYSGHLTNDMCTLDFSKSDVNWLPDHARALEHSNSYRLFPTGAVTQGGVTVILVLDTHISRRFTYACTSTVIVLHPQSLPTYPLGTVASVLPQSFVVFCYSFYNLLSCILTLLIFIFLKF